jgi:hypothetical protein
MMIVYRLVAAASCSARTVPQPHPGTT